MSELRICVVGASGYMGRELVKAALARTGATLVAAVERQGAADIGSDAAVIAGLPATGVLITDDAEAAISSADAVLDFTVPDATTAFAKLAARHAVAHIIGTTGFDEAHETAIAEAATDIPIVKAGNMSLGVNLLMALTKRVAQALDEDYDIEILEMHHRRKVDAPSGTALMLGDAAAEGRGISLKERGVLSREGQTGARSRGDIGFATLRGGSVIGEHDVVFASDAERVVLRHVATDRGIFARGAVAAALWARGKDPGLYSMLDVLGLGEASNR
ncbi:MAG: 4-hydroxy-tetrahydrodipicolinate reductase [Pseudomonadota bacterium]